MTNLISDLDGVFVNWVKGALKAHGRTETHDDIVSWNFYKDWGMTDREFWAPMAGSKFWEDLEPYPWMGEFYEGLCDLGDVYISTSPNSCPHCHAGKLYWLKKHLGIKPKRVMIGGAKHLMAGNGVLIDDYVENVHKFREAGGTALLFKQPWNSGYISYGWSEILDILKKDE